MRRRGRIVDQLVEPVLLKREYRLFGRAFG